MIETEAQDGDDFGIESVNATLGEMLDEVIEASLPAECPRDNLSRQRPVALVL